MRKTTVTPMAENIIRWVPPVTAPDLRGHRPVWLYFTISSLSEPARPGGACFDRSPCFGSERPFPAGFSEPGSEQKGGESMPEAYLQAAFEIKASCDEISRRILRWHWDAKPGPHSFDSLLEHIARRQEESPHLLRPYARRQPQDQLAAAGYHPVYAGAAGPRKRPRAASGSAGQHGPPGRGPQGLQRGAHRPQRSGPRLGSGGRGPGGHPVR